MPEPQELARILVFLLAVFMLAPYGVLFVALLSYRARSRQLRASARREQRLGLERTQALLEKEQFIRQKVAADLHDELGLDFSLLLSGLYDATELSPRRAQQSLPAIIMHGERYRARMVTLLNRIRAARLPQEDALTALHEVVETVRQAGNFTLHWEAPGALPALDADRTLFLRCMLQEALNNIIKHAHARTVWVCLTIHDRQLALRVEDDGTGFDTSTATGGHGLTNFRERCGLLDGHFTCKSQPQRGTELTFSIPLNAEHDGHDSS